MLDYYLLPAGFSVSVRLFGVLACEGRGHCGESSALVFCCDVDNLTSLSRFDVDVPMYLPTDASRAASCKKRN